MKSLILISFSLFHMDLEISKESIPKRKKSHTKYSTKRVSYHDFRNLGFDSGRDEVLGQWEDMLNNKKRRDKAIEERLWYLFGGFNHFPYFTPHFLPQICKVGVEYTNLSKKKKKNSYPSLLKLLM